MNKKLVLSKRPSGTPGADTWSLTESELEPVADGQVLVKNIYASLDPAMRGWIKDRKSYVPPVEIGQVMRALTVGQVVQSKHSSLQPGDYVHGVGGIQLFTVTDAKGWHRVDAVNVPLQKYLSILGLTGFTAYFGLLDIGLPKKGETILVSGAAGAVGSVVGQIGRIIGCKMIGIAGGQEKCERLVNRYGYEAGIDYKSENVWKAVQKLCPEGIDVYFDNVGGEILDIALAHLNFKGRVVLCGGVSQYNAIEMTGPSNYLSLLTNRGRMEGFIVFDYAKEYPIAGKALFDWMQDGLLHSDEHIDRGIENFYVSFLKLFSGEKKGKLILQLNDF